MTSVGSVSGVGSATSTALSGLRAASLRLDVAANNLANVSTEGFVPAHVLGSDLPEGGVRSTVRNDQRRSESGEPNGGETPEDAPAGETPEPNAGFPPAALLLDEAGVPSSSVNPVAEIVSILLAKAAFIASLRVLQHDTRMSKHLMEILG